MEGIPWRGGCGDDGRRGGIYGMEIWSAEREVAG